ncbi:MAG: NADPH:quinone oxidoreductase family protein [Alphaproteobacteria bacterium]|nr:NADPH:quinone oxidoreductase family protein [Alphaproteobacteria bacterium]
MQAMQIKEHGGIDLLGHVDIESPPLKNGQARIKVLGAGLNFADLLAIKGTYQDIPPLPFAPGMEIAGEVIEVADDADGVYVGDKVVAAPSCGGYATEVVTDCNNIWQSPANMPHEEAAGFPIAYGTAELALHDRAHLKDGEILLVHGAAGGVGLAAVQLGKAMGATVIATAGSDEKCELAKKNGADFTINYSCEDIKKRVLELVGKVDVVFDPVGGNAFYQSLKVMNPLGRILLIGFASNEVPRIPANHLLVKNVDVLGFYWGAYIKHDPKSVKESFNRLQKFYNSGRIKPHISASFPLAQATAALEALKSRKYSGKIILTMD